MFDDLTENNQPREDFKDKIEELSDILKESRDSIRELQNDYDEVKQDAGRFARHIKAIHDRIKDEGLENIFQDLCIDEMEKS
jgi:chromosome segregation ATPase